MKLELKAWKIRRRRNLVAGRLKQRSPAHSPIRCDRDNGKVCCTNTALCQQPKYFDASKSCMQMLFHSEPIESMVEEGTTNVAEGPGVSRFLKSGVGFNVNKSNLYGVKSDV